MESTSFLRSCQEVVKKKKSTQSLGVYGSRSGKIAKMSKRIIQETSAQSQIRLIELLLKHSFKQPIKITVIFAAGFQVIQPRFTAESNPLLF